MLLGHSSRSDASLSRFSFIVLSRRFLLLSASKYDIRHRRVRVVKDRCIGHRGVHPKLRQDTSGNERHTSAHRAGVLATSRFRWGALTQAFVPSAGCISLTTHTDASPPSPHAPPSR